MAEAELVIRGGRVVDANGSRQTDVAVRDGMVVAVGEGLSGDRELDAGGCVVGPGLVDLHSHLREPGKEEAETVETGSRAAARGGFTAVVAMPNTTPAIDSAGVVREVQALARGALCAVHPSAALTVGRRGEQLTPMAELAELGVRLFTDDGNGLQDDRLMRRAMEYAGGLPHDVVLAQHCEVEALAEGGHMNEGAWSSRLGIPGIPAAAEEVMVARDLALARLTGARVHFQHMSTAGSVELIRQAKAAGARVTAEVAPHHLVLTDAEVASYDPIYKVNPPLRAQTDVDAVRAGLVDGTLDVVATDHAPHTQEDKEKPFDSAPPGMLGLEYALSVVLTEVGLPVEEALAVLSWKAAAIVGLSDHGGPIEEGRPANLCVIDPSENWVVDPADSASRSRNNPYAGRKLTGRVRHTIYAGEPVVVGGEAQR
ncbi:MAG TPA: dihydroorotase [Acidimicrobiales bacterium]|nr:dihydroorotase [Acidimicrobiales bacterium]